MPPASTTGRKAARWRANMETPKGSMIPTNGSSFGRDAGSPAAPKTTTSSTPSEDQPQNGALLPARCSPQSGPRNGHEHKAPRPSSPNPLRSTQRASLMQFYPGESRQPGRFSEGVCLRRVHRYRFRQNAPRGPTSCPPSPQLT
jgi:hypothetical protein